MEDGRGRIKLEGGVRFDAGIMPAILGSVIQFEHVVGHVYAEAKFGFVDQFLFGHSRANFSNRDLHINTPFFKDNQRPPRVSNWAWAS